jgi:hypothetical protein
MIEETRFFSENSSAPSSRRDRRWSIRFALVAAQANLGPLDRQASARMFARRPRRDTDPDPRESHSEPARMEGES